MAAGGEVYIGVDGQVGLCMYEARVVVVSPVSPSLDTSHAEPPSVCLGPSYLLTSGPLYRLLSLGNSS